jgi:aminomethyltransferase
MTQSETALKRTPLHAAHVRLGARMIPFGGWDMPVQYSGIVEEHRAVRSAVGCFDVSHMGEFEFRGPDALGCSSGSTNDVSTLEVGQVNARSSARPAGRDDSRCTGSPTTTR